MYQLLQVLELEEKVLLTQYFSDSLYVALLFHRWDPNRVGPLWEKRWERGVWDRLIEREPESRS